MKLDINDIKFLETYNNVEFYFESGLLNYFVKKYGVIGKLQCGERYLGSYEYSLILDNLTINFSATLDYNLLEGEDCLKVDSYGFEVFDNVENELVNLEVSMDSKDNKDVRFSQTLPVDLNKKVEKKAKSLGLSKNAYIRMLLMQSVDND
ncbi:hypothetical protein [Clostridium beijerinckii]|uniref:hypothetical protein n=1 Tax=Clostridium beijerinckii TaxID=1520 RepID=UPI0024302871|nr:hypothetical protein [Clostridium beijerinckii]MDG5857075.1 hypothetical protein [Clostridium beijerinckii]